MSKVIQKIKSLLLHRSPGGSVFIRKNRNTRIIGIAASTALVLIALIAVFPITIEIENAEGTQVSQKFLRLP